MTTIEVAESADALSHVAAEYFERCTTTAVRARGSCAVVLSGGSTPAGVYRVLADEPFRSRVPWDRIEFFWGDERVVPPDHSDSNYGMAAATLLARVPIPSTRIHRIRGEMADPALAAQEYEDVIRASLGATETTPRFDLILLGLGADGHTASLFPASSALAERSRLCVANWVAALDAYRITLTLPLLNAARAVVFIVSGAEKAPIVRDVLRPSAPSRDLPARLVAPTDGELWWMLDRAAARDLGSHDFLHTSE